MCDFYKLNKFWKTVIGIVGFTASAVLGYEAFMALSIGTVLFCCVLSGGIGGTTLSLVTYKPMEFNELRPAPEHLSLEECKELQKEAQKEVDDFLKDLEG